MPIPKNKSELLEQIQTHYLKLESDLRKIPENQAKKMGIPGNVKGTEVSPADVVAYLVGWGELVLKWHQKKSQNLPVDFPETGFKWTELGPLAQKFHQDYQDLSYHELLEALEHTVSKIVNVINDQTNEMLYEVPWYGKWTFGRMIQLNTSSPYKSNRAKIRKWMRENGLF